MGMVDKRLVFTITSGRSGTMLLSKLLNICPNVNAKHEPEPTFSDAYYYKRDFKEFLLEEKLPKMLKSEEKIYIETSHIFCKWFLKPAVKLKIPFDLIYLKRDDRKTALSFYQLNDIPDRTETGKNWLLKSKDTPKEWSDYQMCYWYVLEMKKIANNILKKYGSKKKIITISLKQLLVWNSFKNFLNQLNVEIPNKKEYEKIIKKKWNIKEKRKEEKQPCDINKEEYGVNIWFNNKNALEYNK